MPVCPKCWEEIDHFKYEKRVWCIVMCGTKSELIIINYYCPKCNTLLFDNENDATAFLEGDLEAQLKALANVWKNSEE